MKEMRKDDPLKWTGGGGSSSSGDSGSKPVEQRQVITIGRAGARPCAAFVLLSGVEQRGRVVAEGAVSEKGEEEWMGWSGVAWFVEERGGWERRVVWSWLWC